MTTMSSDPLREALLRKTLKERLAAKAQQATVTKPTFPEMTLPEPPAQPQEPMGPPSSLAPLAPKASQGQRAGKAPAPPTTLTRASQPQRAGAAPAPAAGGRDIPRQPGQQQAYGAIPFSLQAKLAALQAGMAAIRETPAQIASDLPEYVGEAGMGLASAGLGAVIGLAGTAVAAGEQLTSDGETIGQKFAPTDPNDLKGRFIAFVADKAERAARTLYDLAKPGSRKQAGEITADVGEQVIAQTAPVALGASQELQQYGEQTNTGGVMFSPSWFIRQAIVSAPQTLGIMAAEAAGGPAIGFTSSALAEGGSIAASVFQKLKAQGMSDRDAARAAAEAMWEYGPLAGILERVGPGEFAHGSGGFLARTATGAIEEAATEPLQGGAQELIEAGHTGEDIDPNFTLTRIGESLSAGATGVGISVASPRTIVEATQALKSGGDVKRAADDLAKMATVKQAIDDLYAEQNAQQERKAAQDKAVAEGLDPGDGNEIPPEEKFKGEITDSLAASYADKSAGHANLAVQIEARVQNGDIDRNTASFFYRLTEDASGDHLGRIDITGQTAPIGEESGRNAAGHFAEDARGRLRIKISRYLQRSFDKGESEGFDVTPLATLLEEYAHAGHWAGLNEQQNAAAQSIRDSMTPEARQKFFLDLYDGDAEAAKYADSTYAEWLAHMAVAHWIGKPIPSSTLGKILDAMFTKFKNVIKKMRGLQIDPKLADIVEVMRTGRQPTAKAAPNAAENKAGVRSMPVAVIGVDANTFQFRTGGNKEGEVATNSLKIAAWDNNMAGVIAVWYWPEKGQYYVVNGHHRLAAAKRLGVEQVDVKEIVADNPQEAAGIGALINIAEGRGEPVDVAKFMRSKGLTTQEQLRSANLSVTNKLAQQGLALAKLNPNIFKAHVEGDLTLVQAVAIGEADLNDADQAALWSIIKRHKKMSEATLREFIAQVKSSDTVEGEDDGGLFPTDKTEINTGIFRAELTAYIADRLGSATRLFKYLSDEDRQAMVEQAGGGKIHGEATTKQAQVAAIAQAYFNARKHAKGSAIAEALSSAAVRLAKGANKNKVKAETLKTIVAELERAAKNKEAFARDIAKKRGEKGGLLFVDENAEEKRSAAGKKLADARRALMVKDREKFGELSSPTGGQHPIVDVHPNLKGVRVLEYVNGPFAPKGRKPGPNVQRPIPIGSRKTIENEVNKPMPFKARGGDYNGGLDERQRFAVNLALTQFFNHDSPAFLLADGPGVGKTRQILVIADQIAKREQNKPILLITKSRQILAGSFRADRNALGISQSLRVKQGTYHDLRAGKYRNDDFGLVVFDESHGLKNPYSQQAEAGRMVKANHTLYVTATPIDKSWHSLYYLAALSGIPLEDYARGIGLDVSYETDPQTGEQKLKVKTVEGANPQDAMKEVAERTREAFDKGLIVRRHYPFWGNIKSTRATPDAAESEVGDYGEESVRAEEWWREHIKKSKPKKRRFLKGQMLFDLSRHVEPFKIEAAIERMQDTLKHGGQVVFVVESVNTTEIKGLTDQEPGTDAPIVGEERRGTGTLLHERLAELDIEAAKIHGPVTIKQGKYERTFNPNVSDEIRRFQSGELRVAIMTPQSGGTGVNLDDRKGDAPRTMIVLTTNFSAMDVEQIWFRISRRTTKSPSLIENLTVSGSYSDHIRGAIIRQKWQNMREGQGQESDDALLDNRDNGAFGRDIKDMLAGKVGTKPIEGKPGYVRIVNEKTGESLSAGQFHEVNDAADLAKAIRRIRAERGVMRRAERLKEEDANSLFPKPKPEVLNADLPRKEGESEEDYRIRKKFREAEINTGKLFEQDDVKKYTDWRDGIEREQFGRNFSMKPWAAEDAYRDAPPSTTGRVPSWLTSQFPTASQAMRVHMATEARVLSMRRKYPTIKSQMHLPIKVLARKFNTTIGAPSMTLDQFGLSEGRVESLNPLAGSPLRLVASGGAEAVVFEEISTGIIYKFMPGAPSAKHGWLFGLRPTQVIKGHGTSVENGEGMSRLVERAAVLNRVGPATEFLGITDEGYAVYKQAKSVAHVERQAALKSLSDAGVVMSYSDDNDLEHLRVTSSDPVPIVAVQGVVFGVYDLHGGNTAKGKTRLGILDPALARLDRSMYRGPDAEVELVSDVKAAINRDEAGYHQYRMFGRNITAPAAMVKDRASAPPRIQVAKIVTPTRKGKGPKIKQMIERLGQIVKREVKRAGHARGSIGTYYPWTTLTSIRYHGDIDTSLHEASHALDDRFFIVGAWAGKEEKTSKTGSKYWRYKKAPFDDELSLFWWHGSAGESGPRAALDYKRTEGVAEWVRAWVLNPTATEAVSPLFTAHFKSVVPEAVRDALQDLGREIRSWAGSPAIDRLLSNVDVDPSDYTITGMMRKTFGKKGWEYETPWYRRLQANMQDALAPFIAGVNAAVQMQGVNLPPDSALFPSQNPILLARLYAGIGDAVEEQFQNGPVDRDFKPVADVGGVAWLFGEMDQTSAKSLEQDVKDTIALLIAERVIERIDRLLGIQHDVISRHNEIGRLLTEYKNLAKTKPRTKAIADRMSDIMDEIEILKREIAALMRKAGYKGPPVVDAFLRWVLDRRRNMVGTHGGVAISNTPGHEWYYGDEATMRQTIKSIKDTPDRYTRLSESARRYREWAEHMVLRPLLDSGRLSHESYNRIKDQNEFYVNMSRVMEEVYEPTKKVPASAVGRTASILPRFKGSRRMIMNPYISLLDSAFRAQKEARRNEALRAFTDLLTTKPTRGMHMGEARALAAIGHQVNATDPGGIKVFRHGKPEYWVFEKEIHKALLDMGEWVAPVALRLATLPVSMTRTAIVYFPGFLVRNIPRDIGHRFLNTRVGSGIVLPLLKATLLPLANYTVAGVKSLAAGESVAKAADKALAAAGGTAISEYRAAGGGQAGHYLHSEKNYYRRLKRELRKMASDPVSHVIATPGMILRGYAKLAQASELTNRRIEYEKAKKVANAMGYNERDAVLFATYEGRRFMDYQVAGRWMRVLNRFVLFLNPQIQGLKVTAESAMTRPASFLIRFSVGLLLPIIALRMLSRAIGGDDDEEEYLNLPAYKRDLFFCIKLGTNRWLFIPKPYEMGVIASGVDRMISAYLGHEDAWHNYPKNIFNTVFPFDEGNMAGPMQAFVEAGANYDFFRDRSIIPWYEQDLPVWSRKGAQNSPGVSKLIAGAIGNDPRIVTHVLGSLTGDAGRIAMQATTPDGLDARAAFYKTLGILGQSPAFEAVAVERARKEAAALGQTGSKEAQYLGDLLDQWRQAKGNEERAAMAKRVRAFATQIRKQWEPSMKIIEQTGKRPTSSNSAGATAALR